MIRVGALGRIFFVSFPPKENKLLPSSDSQLLLSGWHGWSVLFLHAPRNARPTK
jgi:hypothetical protein